MSPMCILESSVVRNQTILDWNSNVHGACCILLETLESHKCLVTLFTVSIQVSKHCYDL